MRRSLLLSFVCAALVAASCLKTRPPPEECELACAVALDCGVLPSLLGGTYGYDAMTLLYACEDRCGNSDIDYSTEADTVKAILNCLSNTSDGDICGIDACVETVSCLRDFLPETALGQPEVMFKLIDGEFWTLLFEPQLCDEIPPGVLSIQEHEIAPLCASEADPCPPRGDDLPYLRPPLCVGDGCLSKSNCDPRLCGQSLTATYECAFMGIETVQFGWLDEREILHLDPNIYTCEEAIAGQYVEGIRNEVIYPVALFNGTLTTRVLNLIGAPVSAEGRSYCWFSHPIFPPEVGWLVRSGSNVIAVPSPGSGRIAGALSGDPNVFPRGCGCLLSNVGCEDDANANCENEIDDDRDGLLDSEDPGCF